MSTENLRNGWLGLIVCFPVHQLGRRPHQPRYRTYGCEFGYFQRAGGYDVSSLLRYAAISPANLTKAFQNSFADIHDEENIILNDQHPRQWTVSHKLHRFHMAHTGFDRDMYGKQEARRRLSKVLMFLRRQLLEDIEANASIWLYKTKNGVVSDEQIAALSAAFHAHNPDAILLYVREAANGRAPFSVERRERALLVGEMDWFGAHEKSVQNHAGWAKLCVNVLAVVDG